MLNLRTQLIPLLRKDPIVSTFASETIISHPKEVIASYNQHAATYVEFDLLQDLEQRFIDKLARGQTPKACLVARYGYGKTTAAIGLWQASCRAEILAIPPASYTSIAEIATTAYLWVRISFQENASVLVKLGELYSTYLRSSTDELAKLVSRSSSRSYDQVMEVLTDPALEGSLRLDPPATNIVLFLEALTHIVVVNGYVGLAIFVDEFQQLLGKAGADVLTALRDLIWGLLTRKIPLGLVITMDPNSENILGERAGDILHRIKDDDLYIDFRQIHSVEFPKLLWEHYTKQLELGNLTFHIVDKPALEALGQICDRADLSNGPRTVANAFRRIASYYADTEKTYTPLQLIDDFLTGAIIFDGDANTIASFVTEFSGYAYFKRTDAHLAVLKLLAAFPAGCPREIADKYDLTETFEQITSELRGDIVTLLPSGYALIDLQRVGKPLNKLSLILKKYWMQIGNTEEEPIENIRRFATYVLPLLFPEGKSPAESWSIESSLSLSANNSYTQTFVGRLHARHPLRRVRIHICSEASLTMAQTLEKVDIDLAFVICTNTTSGQKAWMREDKCLVFYLNLGRIPTDGLPADLRIVEHNLSPQPGTPAVLFSVIEFVEREISAVALKQSEQVQVSYTLENIRRWLLYFIFDEHLLGLIDPETATPGYRGIRDLLFRECERRFPHYSTLVTSAIWRENLAIYREILSKRTLAERRGIEPVEGSKMQIAALFGQRNHAGFDSKIRVQYPCLLDITWTGEQARLLFISHPIETEILTSLTDEGCSYGEVVGQCQLKGYAREEIEEILLLLITRGQIKEDEGRIYKIDTLSAAELRRLGTELFIELQSLKTVISTEDVNRQTIVAQSLVKMDVDVDFIRQDAHARLVSLTERMASLRTQARLHFLELLERQRSSTAALLRSLERPIPGFSSEASFKNHLDGVRKKLEVDRTALQRSGTRLSDAFQKLRSKFIVLSDSEISSFLVREAIEIRQCDEMLGNLQKKVENHLHTVGLLDRWVNWGTSFVRLKHNVANLVASLEKASLVDGYLNGKLDEIESNVREQLAQQGIPTLQQIDEVQQILDEIAREYDRNLLEREKAFEQEKLELETAIALLTPSITHLRSKYQISKHSESYQDLYLEAAQIIQETLRSLIIRIQSLELHTQNIERQGILNQTVSNDRKALKTVRRKIVEPEKILSPQQLHSTILQDNWYKNLVEKVASISKQVDEIERHLPNPTTLSLTGAVLLSKVTSHQQNLKEIIDLEAAAAGLSPESEIGALLHLCLNGNIILKIEIDDSPA